jgi:hypothetical protein
MIFTCPGIASPRVNRKKRTFPEIVIERAMAYAAILARSKVKNTEKTATITLFLKGVINPPESNNVRKLSRVQVFGNARGVE